MARALIVGCGCSGRELGRLLLERGWQVRGSSRGEPGLAEIAEAGIEPLRADPDRVGTVASELGDVSVLIWLLGALGPGSELNGARLSSLLEKVVDSPVRGFLYERAAPDGDDPGAEMVGAAGERWRIPVRVIELRRPDRGWAQTAAAAAGEVLGL